MGYSSVRDCPVRIDDLHRFETHGGTVRHLILLFVIALTSYYFKVGVIDACPEAPYGCYEMHRDLMADHQYAPYQYRILTPLLVQVLMTNESEGAFLNAYLVLTIICFAAFFVGMNRWLSVWMGQIAALLFVALIALIFPLAFEWWWYAPYTALELALVVWGLLCLRSIRHSSLSPV